MNEERSLVRQLTLLVVVLIISNVALGAFGFYFLRTIDRRYTELINRTVPTLNDMQTLTTAAAEAMRSTRVLLSAQSSADTEKLAAATRAAIDRDHMLRSNILRREWSKSSVKEREAFNESGESFTKGANETIQLWTSGKAAEATRQREDVLRPIFERYISAITKAADAYEADGIRRSDALNSRAGRLSTMILGVGSWPLLIVGVIAIVTAIFVTLVLLNVFVWQREST